MTRDEAAALLGVPANAGPDAVRHAWRVWARLAHPDAGGDAEHFARLDRARRLLLQPAVPTTPAASYREAAPAPRPDWSAVLRRPRRPALLLALAVAAVALALLPALAASAPGASLVLVALPAAVAAAAWAVAVTRGVLGPAADPGHRMTVLAVAWLPACLAQLLVSALAGAALVPVLPLLAVPLVVAVAAVNPGAGLWRPIGTGRSVPVR